MSLRPEPIGTIPAETVRVAKAAFPKGTTATRLRDEFSALYQDEDFGGLYPTRGQPGLPPWRLALVTVFQFSEQLSDRQAADAVRARIDWKYALGLELTDPGFHFSVLTEFRARLIAGDAAHLLLDRMLTRFRARGLVKARGKQRTDSTHVLAAVHDLHLLELVAETLRAALDDLAAVAPDWLRGITQPVWFERYGRRVEDYRLPKGRAEREALALAIGADGFSLLEALDAPDAPAEARGVPMVGTLRDVWRVHYAREGGGPPRWRSGPELPPVGERLQSPYDPEVHYSTKRQMEWSGYKVHVTEVCDADAAHLVTNVMTCPAMQPDMASTAAIHEQLAAKDLLPAEHFVDAGYVDAGLLVGSRRDHAVALEGPVRAMPQRATEAERSYEQRHFVIDWKHERVTCPQGKTSVTWRATRDEVGAPRFQAVFSRTDCGACPARRSCTSSKERRRSVYFLPRSEYEALNAARDRMQDPVWKERYRIRAGIEGTLSQGVRAFGLRRSRYIGQAKTGLQHVCVAAAMNASRAVHWLAETPPGQNTRDTVCSLGRSCLIRRQYLSYIWTREGWLYLAVVLDLYSRRVVGWAVGDRLHKELALTALRRALVVRQPGPGLLHHSDRGSQYCSNEYQAEPRKNGTVISMSGRGNCYDNAMVETFFKTLKSELVWRTAFQTRAEAIVALAHYIDGFYNPRRRHSALGFTSPTQFERGIAHQTALH